MCGREEGRDKKIEKETKNKRSIHYTYAPGTKQCKQFPCVVQVITCDFTKTKRVQVAERDGGEHHLLRRDFIQFGNVRILQVELNSVRANIQQEGQGAQKKYQPQAASDADPVVRKDVRDAMKC